MPLRATNWTDEYGRNFRVLIPEGAPESEAEYGIPVGPPDLEALGLPEDIEVKLHNELHARGLFTERELRRDRAGLQAAVAAALRLDAEAVWAIYREAAPQEEATNAPAGREHDAEQPIAGVHNRRRIGSRRDARLSGTS